MISIPLDLNCVVIYKFPLTETAIKSEVQCHQLDKLNAATNQNNRDLAYFNVIHFHLVIAKPNDSLEWMGDFTAPFMFDRTGPFSFPPVTFSLNFMNAQSFKTADFHL